MEDETKQMLSSLANVSSDEQTLDAKIEKKKADLERQQKRLAQLQVNLFYFFNIARYK